MQSFLMERKLKKKKNRYKTEIRKMKKYLFTMLAAVLCTTAFAKDPIKTTSGNPAVIQGKKIYVTIDNSTTIIVDEDSKKEMSIEEFCKMQGGDWLKDMGKDDVEALEEFNMTLSDKSKKFEVVSNKADADYILVCKADKFSYGNPFAFSGFMSNDTNGFFIGRFFIQTPSGETVAEMSCSKITADNTLMSWTRQKRYVYQFVAKRLASFLNKA